MNQIALSDDKQVASLGPGCRWGDVITTLDAQGTTVIGGRMPPVGVAGLILGGMHLALPPPMELFLSDHLRRPLSFLWRIWPCSRQREEFRGT